MICFVITRLVAGGAQKVLLDLIDGLPSDEFDIHLIAGTQTGREGSLWQECQARLSESHLHPLENLVREPHPIKDCRAYRDLKKLFQRLRPDIVHTHTSKAGILGRMAAHSLRVPTIIHSTHGIIYNPEAKIPGVSQGCLLKIFLWLEQKVGRYTQALITLSEQETGDALRLHLAAPACVEAISNGIPLQKLAEIEREPANWKVPHLRLGIAGRLNTEKGHELLLRCFKRLHQRYPKLSLKIAGDGPLREELEKLCKELGLIDHVFFLGYQNNMAEFLANIDLFVLSSHYEGFGLVLVEAMAAGLPVVATDVGGVREVVMDGKTGILVPSGQEDELAMGIEYIIDHPNLAYDYGQNGRKHAMERFSKEQMLRRHLVHYGRQRQGPTPSTRPEGYVPIDLHMHSHHSHDSKTKLQPILEAAHQHGLRAIAITDHDNLGGSLEAMELAPKGLLVIPGMEITSEVGDIIALFIHTPIKALDLDGIVAEVRAQDGLLYLPHPFRGRRSLSLDLIKNMDVFEVFNGRSQGINYNDDSFGNSEIVQFAQEHRLTGMGGSDAHKPAELMRVLTWVPAFHHAEELKALLRSGKIFPIQHFGEWLPESLEASGFGHLAKN